MLYVFYGDAFKARAKARQLVQQLASKEPDALIARFSDENWDESQFMETIVSRGLFKSKQLVVLDMLVRHDVAGPVLSKVYADLQVSEHIVILVEGSLLRAQVAAFEKTAEKIQEFIPDTKMRVFDSGNSFVITDALFEKSPQKLFIELERARLQGKRVEEVVGLLFWAAKTMIIATTSNSAGAARLKEYTYMQGVRGGRAWGETLGPLAEFLARAPHRSRRKGEDGFKLLERGLLVLCA